MVPTRRFLMIYFKNSRNKIHFYLYDETDLVIFFSWGENSPFLRHRSASDKGWRAKTGSPSKLIASKYTSFSNCNENREDRLSKNLTVMTNNNSSKSRNKVNLKPTLTGCFVSHPIASV